VALKYLERDEQVTELGSRTDEAVSRRLVAVADEVTRHLKATLEAYPEAVIADHRYGYINSLMHQGVIRRESALHRQFLSDKIDRVVVNRIFGPLIMAGVILGLYQFTFTYSAIPVAWVEALFEWMGGVVDGLLPDGLLKSLVSAGIIDGVGGVLGFVPLILFMFFGIALLEDSGYLARVAFMLDRIFRVFGLHGSSVMAFMVSGGIAGGCAVPGVMATRTLKSPRERLATLLTVPFMNCGAKLPVFALLVAAFFARHEALVMFLITVTAWGGALLTARLLRSTIVKGESTPFVMELPPYRVPTLRGVLIHTWERGWQYIKKAGTIILGISIVLWALMSFPNLPESRKKAYDAQREAALAAAPAEAAARGGDSENPRERAPAAEALRQRLLAIEAARAEAALRHSVAGRLGSALESVSWMAGFDWRTNIALVGGFAAKEVVVSTLGTAHSLGAVDPEETGPLPERLAAAPDWNPAVALALIVFTIFYAPCFVSVVCIAREAGSWKWGAFSMLFNTLVAFVLAVVAYRIGAMIGLAEP
jgi:ferrous iron transport protein B